MTLAGGELGMSMREATVFCTATILSPRTF